MQHRLCVVALGAAVFHGYVARAEDVTKPKVDQKADELLRKMTRNLAAAKTFQFDADHVLEVVTEDGQTLQFLAESRVAVQRPNKARSDRIGKIADATFYYDGKNITVYGKRANLFATAPAPDTLENALDFARDKLQLEAPAADLVYMDAYDGLMQDVESGRYLGLEPIEGRMCHHLAYRSAETDWQIWIEDDARALPCRYVIKSKLDKGQPEFEVAFSNWNLAPRLPADYFEFKPPRGATQISFFGLDRNEKGSQP